MKVFVFGVVLVQILGVNLLIVPDEIPTLLSVIYANIPTFKKGTDSRVGWGFRLGDRADFQIITEYGPQLNTRPLRNQEDKSSSSNKRNTINSLANNLYAEQSHRQRIKVKEAEREQAPIPNADGEGADWLKNWSKSANKHQGGGALPLQPKPGLAIGEIDAKSVIPEDSVLLAQEMRRKNLSKLKIVVSTEKSKTTTSKEDALDNVDLD